MLSYREALTRATDQLSAHPDLRPTALADAVTLLMHSLRVDRPTLIAHPERLLDREQQAEYQRLIERRLRFEPIQYISGTQDFYGLALRVSPAVLIPRPETELLVESALAHLSHDRALRIVDVGTGSGAIALALATHLPQATITAVDLSLDALDIAQSNIREHRFSDRIRILKSDLLESLENEQPFDAIVSNPPYVARGDAPTLHPQVRDFEPHAALFAGDSGLDIYRSLIPQAERLLKPGGLLALEFGFDQADDLRAMLAHWRTPTLLDDLQGIPRVALAWRV
jgi:release factor glutamine methyltransferase